MITGGYPHFRKPPFEEGGYGDAAHSRELLVQALGNEEFRKGAFEARAFRLKVSLVMLNTNGMARIDDQVINKHAYFTSFKLYSMSQSSTSH